MAIWGGNPGQFDESSNYIMGWLRDYLWLNSSPLINGYNPFGMNNLAVWAWMFLFGHLIWATGFMFLISWRGYWQELIETLVWAHERTPLANLVRWRDKPVALSIVQARLVGLVHFAVGYICSICYCFNIRKIRLDSISRLYLANSVLAFLLLFSCFASLLCKRKFRKI
jgi:photosystem I P700 chlorophyll a apoprotein A2